VPLQIIDPGVTKSGDPATAAVGDTVVYTLNVFNDGNQPALDVRVRDELPMFVDFVSISIVPDPGLTVTRDGNIVNIFFGTVLPTDSYVVTITTRVNSLGHPPGGVNTATLTTGSPDNDPANNFDQATTTIVEGVLPESGFPPGRVTALPEQPAYLNHVSYGDLWLEIPKLGVRMPIVGVPKSGKGWDVSWLWTDAGYLDGTAFPTWRGNTAIAGHVVLPNGLAGPFARLAQLAYGDRLIIHAWGARYLYEVREVVQVLPGDLSVLRHEEHDWVTLITCSDFSEGTAKYASRVVARAVLVRIEGEKGGGAATPVRPLRNGID
jgi:LPXTG-site transpeptidase (sortase) family protein